MSPAILHPGSGQSEEALLFLRPLCWRRCQARELDAGVQAGMDVLGRWLQVQPTRPPACPEDSSCLDAHSIVRSRSWSLPGVSLGRSGSELVPPRQIGKVRGASLSLDGGRGERMRDRTGLRNTSLA